MNPSALQLDELHRLAKIEWQNQRREMQVLRVALDVCPWPMWVKRCEGFGSPDVAFRMLRINGAYERRWGIAREDYEGKLDAEVWGNDVAAQFLANDLRAVSMAPDILYTEERVPDRSASGKARHMAHVPTWRVGKVSTTDSSEVFVVGIAWRVEIDEFARIGASTQDSPG